MEENEKRKDKEDLLNAGISGASYESVQRYGSAVKQHSMAYSGVDNEAGVEFKRSLKGISQSKVNPDYEFSNIHQQAGFSAEVVDVARSNAESIIDGETYRKIRTDDMGYVNHPVYDTVYVNEEGNVIEGTGAQMKFIGARQNDPSGSGNAKRALNELQKKKFEKYLDENAIIDVPSNRYNEMVQEADKEIAELKRQLDYQIKSGNDNQAQNIQIKIKKLEKIKKNLRKSTVSEKEAIFARNHPGLSTAVDVVNIAHRAGLNAAKSGAVIGGSVSIVKNLVAICKGDIEAEDAAKNILQDVAQNATVGYGTGAVGATLKGFMQNSKSSYLHTLSKTNVPGTIVSATIAFGDTLTRYFKGEIDTLMCLEELGEKGTAMISSAMFSVIGQVAIPIPVVGGMIGGMIGYSISSATYGILTNALKQEQLAHERRVMIEKACEEHIKLIRQYRQEIEKIADKYLSESMNCFRESFSGVKNAYALGDIDWFIESTNSITEQFGGKQQFSSMDEFEEMMNSGTPFVF